MMTIERLLSGLVVAIAVSGCGSDATEPNGSGALAFSQAGNMLGSGIGDDERTDVGVTSTGTLLGAFYGTDVGEALTGSDRRRAEHTARRSLETAPDGETAHWHNPDNGHSGTFTPSRVYQTDDDMSCRDYRQSVTTDGRTKTAVGTACRTAAAWRVAIGTGRPAN